MNIFLAFKSVNYLLRYIIEANIKELVGYAINKRMTADLVCKALNMAIKNKGPSSADCTF